MTARKCGRCGDNKELGEFHKDSSKKDGHQSICKICRRESNRKWHWENRERALARNKEWYQNNKENHRENFLRWREKHPGKSREYKNRRRALKLKAEGSFTPTEFVQLCATYGNKCLSCGEEKPLQADHVIPLSKGGINDITNIQPLCKSCNCSKSTKTIDYREAWE